MDKELLLHTHRRYNPLTGEWILVSPNRIKRPWQGRVEKLPPVVLPGYDSTCYLCPGNVRANGDQNPGYLHTFVFDNDFSSLSHDTPELSFDEKGIIRLESDKGICRVVCFSPRHDLTLAEMEIGEVEEIVKEWISQYEQLGSLEDVNYVQIFENKGELMGCSNPHPHCQVWAESSIPVEPFTEMQHLKNYNDEHNTCLLCEYLQIELEAKERIVCENGSFVGLVPYWATWPFETMVISRRHIGSVSKMTEPEVHDFAKLLNDLTVRYDNLFNVSFPYSSGIHQAPTDGKDHSEWHLHMHFYPPLLRSATIRKFMVGYEMLANPQRDITAEEASAKLRSLPSLHYKLGI